MMEATGNSSKKKTKKFCIYLDGLVYMHTMISVAVVIVTCRQPFGAVTEQRYRPLHRHLSRTKTRVSCCDGSLATLLVGPPPNDPPYTYISYLIIGRQDYFNQYLPYIRSRH